MARSSKACTKCTLTSSIHGGPQASHITAHTLKTLGNESMDKSLNENMERVSLILSSHEFGSGY
ncbi:hypothetical protein FQN50_000321 [Emmonsiellopsis sp. PD_5]|nr:hypothetical protein FQN50_000321 [Emmonsiellopsis sp. PD_5]